VTGSELRSFDLLDRSLVYTAPIPGASSLAYDDVGYRLFIGTDDGQILVFDASGLDGVTSPELAGLVAPPSAFGHVDGGSTRCTRAPTAGRSRRDEGRPARHARRRLGRDDRRRQDRRDQGVRPGGTGRSSRRSVAPSRIRPPCRGPRRPPRRRCSDLRGAAQATEGGTIVAGIGGTDQKANIDAAIADGRLAGLAVQDAPRVAIADSEGVTFVAAPTGDVVTSIALDGGAFGLAYVTVNGQQLYVTTGGTDEGAPGEVATIAVGGDAAKNGRSAR
jgi:hypothetical protein